MVNEEKEKIRKLFPDNQVTIKINPDNPPTESNLSSAEWQIISQVDGKKTLQNIIDMMAITEDEGLSTIYNLYEKKLIHVIVNEISQDKLAGEDFFRQLEEILVKIIGPVATYVINDILWELDENREQLLVEKIPLLTESISREILDESKRVYFQKEMLQLIKTYEIS